MILIRKALSGLLRAFLANLLVALLAIVCCAFAVVANGDDNINASLVREHGPSYSKYIGSGKLNQLVAQYAQRIDASREPNQNLAKLWTFMVDNGLLEDIQSTKYNPSGQDCALGSDPETAASTTIAGPKSPTQPYPNHADVCWDVNKIINERTELSMIITLALHEEAHHFGFDERGAYAITQMVGAQLLGMQIPTMAQVAGQSARELKDSLPLANLKKGTKLRVLQDIPGSFAAMYNGTIHNQIPVDMVGVYCWTNGYFQKGVYKVVGPVAGFTGNEAPGVLSEVSIWLDGPGSSSAIIDCEEHPEGNRILTVEDFIQAVDGIIEIDN